VARTFYRIVKSDPPTLLDFTSNAARGRAPRTDEPEVLRLWSGLSAFSTLAQARRKSRISPVLGAFVARLVLPDVGQVRYERTRGTGHYTLWGEPSVLLAAVVSVVRVSRSE